MLEAAEPWACVTQRHSRGQRADAGNEQGLGSAFDGRARIVVSDERAALGGEPYEDLQSYLLGSRSLQIKTTPTEHSEMGNWEEGTRHEVGDCFR